MQMIESLQDNKSDTKWQIYQPADESLSIFKAFNKEIKNLLIFTIILSIIYLILTLLSPVTILVVVILVGASAKLLTMKISQLKKQGLINKLNPKLRQLLLEKSIFDIYSDLLYFPFITKIIGAFVKPLLIKPHPQKLHHTFQSLPEKFQLAIARKGLLSLAPQKFQDIFVGPQTIKVPETFKVETWEWKNQEIYQKHHEKVHQDTVVKRVVQNIDKKVSWTGFLAMAAMVGFGVYKNPSRFRRMLVQNGILTGLIFILLISIIKIKKMIDQKKKDEQQRKIESLRITLLDKDD